MKDRLFPLAVASAFLAMTVLFGFGAREVWRGHDRERDFPRWIEHPGRLHALTLHETLHRLRWRWAVDCEYVVVVDGVEHAATDFDLRDPRFADADEAKAFVEGALGLAGRARWRKVPYGSSGAWALDAPDLPLKVRHSPRDPSVATLTATPPHAASLAWIAMVALGLLCAATGLGTLAMIAAAIRPETPVRSAAEHRRGEEDLPLVPAAVRERYAQRLEGAIAALRSLREAEGASDQWDAVLSELHDERDAARSGPMRQRRHGLHLSRRLDLGCTTRAQEQLQNEIDKVDAFLREHLVAREPAEPR